MGSSEIVLHTDRGGQIVSGTYQKLLGGNALVCSTSEVGHCADDAACEGFFGKLKRECVNDRQFRTRDVNRGEGGGEGENRTPDLGVMNPSL